MSSSPTLQPSNPSFTPALEEKIRLRAYEIYQRRGTTPGTALEDWLRAESEIVAKPAVEAPANVIALKKPRARKTKK